MGEYVLSDKAIERVNSCAPGVIEAANLFIESGIFEVFVEELADYIEETRRLYNNPISGDYQYDCETTQSIVLAFKKRRFSELFEYFLIRLQNEYDIVELGGVQ